MYTCHFTHLFVLISPLAALSVNCVAQILLFRTLSGLKLLPSVVAGFMAGLVFLAVICIPVFFITGWNSGLLPDICFVALPIYGCLSYGYLHFVNIGEASIRIRIYEELRRHPEGISITALLESYNDASIYELRLKRLVANGDIRDSDGRYYIGRRRFEFVARILFAFKSIILGKSSEPPAGNEPQL